ELRDRRADLRVQAALLVEDRGQVERLGQELVAQMRRMQAMQLAQGRAGIAILQIGVGAFEQRLVPVPREARELLVGSAGLRVAMQPVERAPQGDEGELAEIAAGARQRRES